MLAQHYDIASRELEGFGLTEMERHLEWRGEAAFTSTPSESVSFRPTSRPALDEALDDAREVARLAEMLSPSYFVQAQIFPYSYQNVILRGNATKIDALLMRAYLAERRVDSWPSEPTEVTGGHTEVRRCGVAPSALHCDVTSLYPSLMMQARHRAGDRPPRRFPQTARATCAASAYRPRRRCANSTGAERRDLEALQQTFKILINSFYGYLGFSLGHFNDFVQPTP